MHVSSETERALVALVLLRKRERTLVLKNEEAQFIIDISDYLQNEILPLLKKGEANREQLDLLKMISERRNHAFEQLLHTTKFLSLLRKLIKIQMYVVNHGEMKVDSR